MYVNGVAQLEIFQGDRGRVADSQCCHGIRTILHVWRQTDLVGAGGFCSIRGPTAIFCAADRSIEFSQTLS